MSNIERIYYMLQENDCGHWFRDNADTLKLAEYLDKNGCIAPPCKVGNKIYRKVGDGSIIAWDIVRMDVYVDEMGFVDDSDNWIAFDDIGKTVFLTREETEQSLRTPQNDEVRE